MATGPDTKKYSWDEMEDELPALKESVDKQRLVFYQKGFQEGNKIGYKSGFDCGFWFAVIATGLSYLLVWTFS